MRPILLIIIMFFFTSQWHAQKIVRSSIGAIGSSVSANGILSQQIVGQPGITTHEKSKNGLGLRQGFIQPSWFKTESNELNVVLFPNPNQGDFSFQAEIPEKQYYNYEVMDNNGKLVLKGKGMGIERINISLQNPSPSMYHLNVFTKDQNSAFQINVIN